VNCPHCGTALMDFKVVDTRPSRSGQLRVQLRQCPNHPEVLAGAKIVEAPLDQVKRFLTRARRRRASQPVAAQIDTGRADGRE
jgi:hypothetical protein